MGIHYGRFLNWVDHHSKTQEKLCVVKLKNILLETL